jgi:ribonuclease HI
LTPDGE